jgi:hypothetical protein
MVVHSGPGRSWIHYLNSLDTSSVNTETGLQWPKELDTPANPASVNHLPPNETVTNTVYTPEQALVSRTRYHQTEPVYARWRTYYTWTQHTTWHGQEQNRICNFCMAFLKWVCVCWWSASSRKTRRCCDETLANLNKQSTQQRGGGGQKKEQRQRTQVRAKRANPKVSHKGV